MDMSSYNIKIYSYKIFFSPLPGQLVIAYSEKLLSSYNTSQLLLSICAGKLQGIKCKQVHFCRVQHNLPHRRESA